MQPVLNNFCFSDKASIVLNLILLKENKKPYFWINPLFDI